MSIDNETSDLVHLPKKETSQPKEFELPDVLTVTQHIANKLRTLEPHAYDNDIAKLLVVNTFTGQLERAVSQSVRDKTSLSGLSLEIPTTSNMHYLLLNHLRATDSMQIDAQQDPSQNNGFDEVLIDEGLIPGTQIVKETSSQDPFKLRITIEGKK